MELLTIDTQATKTVLEYSFVHKFPGASTWVNGRQNNDGLWEAWTILSTSSPLEPLMTASLTKGKDLNCLAYKHISNTYQGESTACDQKVERFTCEFKKQPVLQTDSCWKTLDLTDPVSGKIKTACTVGTLANYYEAEQFCLKKGMTLLNGFYDFDAGYFPTDVWISGLKSDIWYKFAPKASAIDVSVAADWAAGGQTSGNCLSLTEETPGNWVGKGVDCNARRTYFVCEHNL